MLHVITPCSRPENLPAVEASLIHLVGPWHWWIVYDGRMAKTDHHRDSGQVSEIQGFPERPLIHPDTHGTSFAAGYLRNVALRNIFDGWVYCLDDDNAVHPRLCEAMQEDHDLVGFRTDRRDGGLYNEPTEDCIDTGGFLWRRERFGDVRFEPYGTTCDGELWRRLQGLCHPKRVRILRESLGFYNYLRSA